ncbi:MAG TPA: acyltransferase [Burkholderiales bacterium]|jgi:peptidoglycan/LPS O-acetylase OafA/YrhL|nr:acyltransferase [Burkholderiales bacterium]
MARPDLRANNFDLLRLLFASAVFFWHVHVLSRVPALEALGRVFSADIAVKGFFVISGYLVMMSWENSAGARDYAGKRLRRIYPAYAAVVLACALAGAFLSSLPPSEYFLSGGFARYLAANLAFLNFLAPSLPGLFGGQPFAEVNGALWTLKIEVMYYALVPALAWLLARFGRGRTLIALYLLAALYSLVLGELHARSGAMIWLQLQRQLPGQLGYFLVGVGLYLVRERLEGRWPALLAAALAIFALLALTASPAALVLLQPLMLGILVIYAAVRLPHLGNFARFGDLSYGVYILHFPVIQALVAAGLFAAAPWTAFGVAAALVALLALASWHWVEKPFLASRSHYRRAEASALRRAEGT